MQDTLKMKDEVIREYEHENLLLKDKMLDYESEKKDPDLSDLRADGKTLLPA